MIKTKISPRKIALMVLETLGIAFFSAFNIVFLLIGIEFITNGSWATVEIRQLVLLTSMISLYPIIVYYRIRRYKKMECWSIDENYLYRGKDKEFKVDLRQVDVAILGLPHIKIKNVLLKFLNPREIESNNSIADNVLILKINNNRYLPLFLFDTQEGFEIMNKVFSIVSNKIVKGYDFNEKEKKALKGNFINKVIDIQT